jgi:hypothetical protein
MQYEDFFVQIHPPQGDDHPVTVHCPAGDGRGTFRVPLTSEELQALKNGFDVAGARVADRDLERAQLARPPVQPEEVGTRLFDALFTEEIRRLLSESLARLPEDGEHGLRIKLCFDPDVMPLGQLPWETLFWKERREFLNLGRTTPLVRYLNVPRGMRPRLAPPLRVLLASACPRDVGSLDLETEAGKIHEALQKIPGVRIQWLRNATAQGIRDKLHEEPFHVFHFMGHGSFDARSGDGAILLEDKERRHARLPGRVVAHLLHDFPSLQLAFLNACRTACSDWKAGLDPFVGVASALVIAGMPAVVAMQFSVSDKSAILFSTAFYRRIAAGDPVDTATTEGRMAIVLDDPRSSEWATPALFLRSWDGCLFELENGGIPGVVSANIRSSITDFSSLIQAKTEIFVGRKWVFDAIARFIQEKGRGYFVIRGEPGIGKTVLIAEMVRRERSIHHFNIRSEGIQKPDQFLRNVCAQLVTTYGLELPSLPPDATEGSSFLKTLLGKIAGKLKPAEKALLLVDALDESDLSSLTPGANALYLPATLPAGVCIVLTTRFKDVPLRIDDEQDGLDLLQDCPQNLEDIRAYVEIHLPRAGIRAYLAGQRLDEANFVTEMVAKSQGNFMYLRHVLPEIESGAFQDRTLRSLPEGLKNYYKDHWDRMRAEKEEAWYQQQLPVLVALTAVQEPISIDLIARFSGLQDRRRVRPVLDEWAQFLYVTKDAGEAGKLRKRYRLYHASFFDFIAAKDEVEDERVNLEEAHRRIAQALEES